MSAYPYQPALGKTETSAAAAPSAKAARHIHRQIAWHVANVKPVTADEFAKMKGLNPFYIRPRFTEAQRLGLIEWTKEKRRNSFGNLMRVYAIAGRAA